MVEQLTLNQLVLGSSPSRGTIFFTGLYRDKNENGESHTLREQRPVFNRLPHRNREQVCPGKGSRFVGDIAETAIDFRL